jgi:hypothetical protein
MRSRTAWETAIICVAAVAAIWILSIPFKNEQGSSGGLVAIVFFGVAALSITLVYRYFTAKKRAQIELTGGEQYRQLAQEYRRLADMAITTQEHTDMKLGEVSVQLDHLREQTASLQKILKDVE